MFIEQSRERLRDEEEKERADGAPLCDSGTDVKIRSEKSVYVKPPAWRIVLRVCKLDVGYEVVSEPDRSHCRDEKVP